MKRPNAERLLVMATVFGEELQDLMLKAYDHNTKLAALAAGINVLVADNPGEKSVNNGTKGLRKTKGLT